MAKNRWAAVTDDQWAAMLNAAFNEFSKMVDQIDARHLGKAFTADDIKRLLQESGMRPRAGMTDCYEKLVLIYTAKRLTATAAYLKWAKHERAEPSIEAKIFQNGVRLHRLMTEAGAPRHAAVLAKLLGLPDEIPKWNDDDDPADFDYAAPASWLFLLCWFYSGNDTIHGRSAAARFVAKALTEAGVLGRDGQKLTPEAIAQTVERRRLSKGDNPPDSCPPKRGTKISSLVHHDIDLRCVHLSRRWPRRLIDDSPTG